MVYNPSMCFQLVSFLTLIFKSKLFLDRGDFMCHKIQFIKTTTTFIEPKLTTYIEFGPLVENIQNVQCATAKRGKCFEDSCNLCVA